MLRWTFVLLLTIAAIGCNQPAGPKAPPKIKVSGSVTLDGSPMPDGEISFNTSGQVPTSFPISNGTFTGEAFTGTNRVELYKYKEGPPLSTDPTNAPTKVNSLAPKYTSGSTFTADVKEGGANDFKFEATSP